MRVIVLGCRNLPEPHCPRCGKQRRSREAAQAGLGTQWCLMGVLWTDWDWRNIFVCLNLNVDSIDYQLAFDKFVSFLGFPHSCCCPPAPPL